MLCIKCKKEIPEGSLYCNHCGKKQTVQTQPHRKRGNGTGSVYMHNGKWTAQITLGWYIKNGKAVAKRHRKMGFATKRDALAYIASYDKESAQKDPTIGYYITTYLNGGFKKLSSSKQDAYRIAMERLSPIAHRKIKSLGINDLQTVIDGASLSYYPARDMKSVLSHIYKLAIAEQIVTVNLSQHIVLPALESSEPEAFTSDEITRIWETYENGDQVAGFVLLMIYTGMMPGELLNTRLENIDIPNRRITGVGLKTKTRKSVEIVLPDAVLPILEPFVNLTGNSPEDPTAKLVRMNKDTFYREYYETLCKSGVRRLKPYSCRHTTATALAAKIPPKTLQRVMRHASFQSTQHYIHPDAKEVLDAVNML